MLRREMHRHVFLAKLLIERVLHSRNAAFPAFAQLFGAREGATIEIEVFLYESIRQIGRAGTDSAPQSPEFPGHQRGGLPHVRHTLQERRLRNNDRAQLFGVCPQRKKPLLERETGEFLVKFGGFDGVVFRLCITVFHDIPVMRGDLGLVRENELCRLHRGQVEALGKAGQLEHGGDMLNIRGAHLFVLLFAVVCFIGQTQPGLGEVKDVMFGVFLIDAGVPPEKLRQPSP